MLLRTRAPHHCKPGAEFSAETAYGISKDQVLCKPGTVFSVDTAYKIS